MNGRSVNAVIKLKSIQINDEESSEIELVTEGIFRTVTGGYELEYDESETTGFENSTTVITCLGSGFASLTRKGAASSDLILEINKKHHCYYDTPFGSLTVGVYTKTIENNLTENGGELILKYTIDVNSAYVSDNEVYLTVEKR